MPEEFGQDSDFERVTSPPDACAANGACGSVTVLLATACVDVQVGLTLFPCRALCDSAAQLNLMSTQCAKTLVRGIGNSQGVALTGKVFADIRARHSGLYVLTAEFTLMD